MRFEEVVDFPNEREAYMTIRGEIGLSEEEYLKLSYIERKELAEAYRVAKKLGVEHNDLLQTLYSNTKMFDQNGVFDLAAATMIVRDKAGILSMARTKLGLTDTIEEFVLKGDIETEKVALQLRKVIGDDVDGIVEHLRPLLLKYKILEGQDSVSRFEIND